MQLLADKISQWIAVIGVAFILMVPQLGYSQALEEEPSMLAMAGDLVLARPLLFATTLAGSVIYIVSLPFSLAGGNAKEAGKTLVLGPAEATFVRCLGCSRPGYKKSRVD